MLPDHIQTPSQPLQPLQRYAAARPVSTVDGKCGKNLSHEVSSFEALNTWDLKNFAILLMFRHLSLCVALHIEIYTLDHLEGCIKDIYSRKFNPSPFCFTRENFIYIELPPRLLTAERKCTSLHRGFFCNLLNAPKPACRFMLHFPALTANNTNKLCSRTIS